MPFCEALKALPIELPIDRVPIGVVTLKNRALAFAKLCDPPGMAEFGCAMYD
jgi:hypothetical protein